jgi:uncharacterized protein YjiS (DUF1127 family)
MTTLTATYCTICEKVNTFFKGIKEAHDKRQSRRSTYKALSSLSDAELNDIGICRGDINHIANGGEVYRRTY